jgi:hypothetical protein
MLYMYILFVLLVSLIMYGVINGTFTTQNNTSDDDRCETMSNLATKDGYVVKSYGYVDNKCDCDRHKLLRHIQGASNEEFTPDMDWLTYHNLLPWWNSTRNTKNMSYDIRGDVPVGVHFVPVWYASPHIGYR